MSTRVFRSSLPEPDPRVAILWRAMILGCPQCETRFRIDDEKVRAHGVKVRCSRCAHTFVARPEDGEAEPPGVATTSTRRVDPAAMIALALETSPQRNPHTEEIPLPTVQDEGEGLFPEDTRPTENRLDELHGVLDAGVGDPFEQLDATPEHPHAEELMGDASSSLPVDLGLEARDVPDLAGVSADLPASPPASSSFLDPGAYPSRDLGFLDALEADFFPSKSGSETRDGSGGTPTAGAGTPTAGSGTPTAGGAAFGSLETLPGSSSGAFGPISGAPEPSVSHPPPPSSSVPFHAGPEGTSARAGSAPVSGPPSGSFGASFSSTSASFEPSSAPGPFSMFGDLDRNGDLIDGPSADDSPLARIDVAPSTESTHTRIAAATAPARVRAGRVVVPRPIGGWPTWLGLILGLLVSGTFFPGVAPAPFDGIGPVVTDWLHPAAAARLPGALPQIHSENASAFPYALDDETLVIVRGEAINLGDEALSGVYAHVLMLDGDREVARERAPLGDAPNPLELRRRLQGEPPPPPIPFSPGARLPFTVVFRAPGPEAGRFRFRVEFTPRDS